MSFISYRFAFRLLLILVAYIHPITSTRSMKESTLLIYKVRFCSDTGTSWYSTEILLYSGTIPKLLMADLFWYKNWRVWPLNLTVLHYDWFILVRSKYRTRVSLVGFSIVPEEGLTRARLIFLPLPIKITVKNNFFKIFWLVKNGLCNITYQSAFNNTHVSSLQMLQEALFKH